jgi:hypothetical protein
MNHLNPSLRHQRKLAAVLASDHKNFIISPNIRMLNCSF